VTGTHAEPPRRPAPVAQRVAHWLERRLVPLVVGVAALGVAFPTGGRYLTGVHGIPVTLAVLVATTGVALTIGQLRQSRTATVRMLGARMRWLRARPVRRRAGEGTTSRTRSLAGSRLVVAVRRLGQHRWTGTCRQGRVSRSRWSDMAAGLVAGVLVFASLPPRGWWWAAVIGLGVLSAVLAQASPRRRLLTGASTGLGWFGPGLAWVNGFSPPGYGLLVAVQVAMLAAACLLAARHWWLLPTALVVFTAARDRFPLGGFPLAGLELGQVGGPLAAVSPLLGPLGVVAVTALAAAGAAQALRRRRPAPLLAVVLAVGLAAAGWLLPVAPTGPTLRVAVVQGGGPRGIPAVRADAAQCWPANCSRLRCCSRARSTWWCGRRTWSASTVH